MSWSAQIFRSLGLLLSILLMGLACSGGNSNSGGGGQVFAIVANTDDDTVTIVNASTLAVRTLALAEPEPLREKPSK